MVAVVPKGAGSVDPGVKMPAAVLRHAERASQIQKEAYQLGDPPSDPPADPPANEQAPAAEPPVTPQGNEPASVEPPAVPPISQVPSTPAPSDPAELLRENQGLRNGINAMRGRLNASEQNLNRIQQRMGELERTIASLQAPAPQQPRDPATNPQSLITPEMRSEYGDELLDVAARAAQERINPEISALREELQTIKNQTQRSAEQQFADARLALHNALDQQVPDWTRLNNDDQFLDWLDLQDQFSGVRRGDLLKAAYDENNTPRVLAFFTSFLRETNAVTPAPAPAPTVDPKTGQPKVDLATLAAPGRGKSPAGQAPQSKPIYSGAQIAAFYADKTAGRYRGKEEEADRIEREIFAAQREGRIRG